MGLRTPESFSATSAPLGESPEQVSPEVKCTAPVGAGIMSGHFSSGCSNYPETVDGIQDSLDHGLEASRVLRVI